MARPGEVVLRTGKKQGGHNIGWILSMWSMHEELDMEARYLPGGNAVLVFPNGDDVELLKDQGMHFINWEDFPGVRNQLQNSHWQGRPGTTLPAL